MKLTITESWVHGQTLMEKPNCLSLVLCRPGDRSSSNLQTRLLLSRLKYFINLDTQSHKKKQDQIITIPIIQVNHRKMTEQYDIITAELSVTLGRHYQMDYWRAEYTFLPNGGDCSPHLINRVDVSKQVGMARGLPCFYVKFIIQTWNSEGLLCLCQQIKRYQDLNMPLHLPNKFAAE